MTKIIEHHPELSPTTKLLRWLSRNAWGIIAGVLAILAIVAWVGIDPNLQREHRLALVTLIAAIPIGWSTGGHVASKVNNQAWVFVVDVDARVPDDAALYEYPLMDFRRLDVIGGKLHRPSPLLAFGKDLDMEAGEIRGIWPGTLSDRELMIAIQKVRECREQLEEDAKRGFVLQTSAWVIVRRATQKAVNVVVDTFEKNTLPDQGEGINDAVDEALEEFGLDRLGELGDGQEELDLEQLVEEEVDQLMKVAEETDLDVDDLVEHGGQEAPADDD